MIKNAASIHASVYKTFTHKHSGAVGRSINHKQRIVNKRFYLHFTNKDTKYHGLIIQPQHVRQTPVKLEEEHMTDMY